MESIAIICMIMLAGLALIVFVVNKMLIETCRFNEQRVDQLVTKVSELTGRVNKLEKQQ